MDEHPRAPGQRIVVDLKGVDAVLQGVLDRDRLAGQPPRLPRRDEARAYARRYRAAEHESPRLRGNHVVDLAVGRPRREQRDRMLERRRVEEQRRDIPEDDPGLGVVRDVADVLPEVERPGRLGHRA